MDILTNRVRIGSLVHSLVEGRFRTSCGLGEDIVAATLLVSDEEVDGPVDCMTCLVDRKPAVSMGAYVTYGYIAGVGR